MNCASCGHENSVTNRFCGGCGAALARLCAACGHGNPAADRFCGACGAPLADSAAERAETRKVVTIVFADLMGSTSLHERLDPEAVSRVMDRYHRSVRVPVEAHGGTVVQLLGDGVMCAFGVPQVAEDDALRAVRAAVGIQEAFREFAVEHAALIGRVGLRVAVNTGEVVVSDDYAAGIGDPLNVAARLQQEARDGDVLIGESTQRLVRDRVTLEACGVYRLKGRAESVAAYRVVSLERPAGAASTPFVGRDDEVQRLLGVFDSAVAARRARLAVILGSPGLGKSRLIAEIGRRLDGKAAVLTAHCDAAGRATFAPIADAFRHLLGVDEDTDNDEVSAAIEASLSPDDTERTRVVSGVAALLANEPAPPEETFFVVRRFLASLAGASPVVLAIDDIQWAEPLLLDLTEHLVEWTSGAPLFVLAAARPELRELRSSLTERAGLVDDVVTLSGLDAGAATRLAANVVGTDQLPAAVAGRVLATSEGNPLFVGELVRMLVHDGALKREGNRWTAGVELDSLEMPPTIHALLAARIERLSADERTVLERASVVGRQFSRAAISHLLPREIADLDARLEALRRSELIEPAGMWFLGEPALRFHHQLIRDAAYRRLLKETRAELHEHLANWIATRVGDNAEHDETIGWHLEQAHQNLRELGPLDARGQALGEQAAGRLATAGRRALGRNDLPLAASLLERAIDRLDEADRARAELALDWCEALLAASDVGPAAAAVAELGRFVEVDAAGRLESWHTCFDAQLGVLTDPQALQANAAAAARAAEAFALQGDDAGEAKAHSVHALALSRLGRIGASEAVLDKALAAARRGEDRRRANAVLAGAPLAALWGPSPVTRASGRCLDVVRVLRITQGAPPVEAVALRCQAVLEALRGRSEASRRMIETSRSMVEDLGLTQGLLETEMFAGFVELIEGDAAAGEPHLRSAYDGLREHGLGIDAARAAALLGIALLAQGRAAEAEALSHEAEALAGDDLQAAITWRRVRAEALARRGEYTAAIELARAAVDIAAATDALLHHADARRALAVALRAAGQTDEAAVERARAVQLWESKGASVLADRARRESGQTRDRADRAPNQMARAIRRVGQNLATLHLARIDAAVAARDLEAIKYLVGDGGMHHHVSGRWYNPAAHAEAFGWMTDRSAGLVYGNECLATLGPSLALARWRESGSEVAAADLPIGPFEVEGTVLIEADAEGRSVHVEAFPADHLNDAVVRLYERYAEILPAGGERERIATAARAIATELGPLITDRFFSMVAPDVEYVDHRMLLGFGSVHGIDAFRAALDTLFETADDVANRVDDVLALDRDAVLLSLTNCGRARAGGGAYERPFLALWAFGQDGLLLRVEQFDLSDAATALARFDALPRHHAPQGAAEVARPALASAPQRLSSARRVQPNRVSAYIARLDAAMAKRDADALAALEPEQVEVVDHPGGTTYDRAGNLASRLMMLKADDLKFQHEPIATLGESLGLFKLSMSATGFAGANFDVASYERDLLVLSDDGHDGVLRGELFAVDRLADALVRLYERYAEICPEGSERTRAAAVALSVAVWSGPIDIDRYAAGSASSVACIDHRPLGTWSARGKDEWLAHWRIQLALVTDFTMRDEDVLAVHPDAFLVRSTYSGVVRSSGGTFENVLLTLWLFDADGLLIRVEGFEPNCESEALARFDELTARRPLPSRVRPNYATAWLERGNETIRAGDFDAFSAIHAATVEAVFHSTGHTLNHTELMALWRQFIADGGISADGEALATLGDRLALHRDSWLGGSRDTDSATGPFETELFVVAETDTGARAVRIEVFASDHLGDAIALLYERSAELLPDGAERERAKAVARSFVEFDRGLGGWARALAPDVQCVDRRILGTWSGHGAEAAIRHFRSLLDLVDDFAARLDDILDLRSDGLLIRVTTSGIDRAGGGAYERPLLALLVFGADGLITRWEQFDLGREEEARARFDELVRSAHDARVEDAAAVRPVKR